MKQTGVFNPQCGAEAFGFRDLAAVHWNLQAPQLYGEALKRGEAKIAAGGALVAETGVHTGRSPKDKFVVRDADTESKVWWDNNGGISREQFELLLTDFIAHARGKELFAQDLYAAADPAARIKARVFGEYAWHSLFIRNLLIRPEMAELATYRPDLTIVDLPSFRADPARHGCRSQTVIACDFARRIVLIGGTSYAGEMKKSVFTYLNYVLPEAGVMPMHCSANSGGRGEVAVFFGLSGTGKTTLSADPTRVLIGDDEHGWGRAGVFNFEGGCYAKAIKLSREAEPEIYATTERFGTVMENVILDPITAMPDFDDSSKTENTRIAYPLDFIENASTTGRDGIRREAPGSNEISRGTDRAAPDRLGTGGPPPPVFGRPRPGVLATRPIGRSSCQTASRNAARLGNPSNNEGRNRTIIRVRFPWGTRTSGRVRSSIRTKSIAVAGRSCRAISPRTAASSVR